MWWLEQSTFERMQHAHAQGWALSDAQQQQFAEDALAAAEGAALDGLPRGMRVAGSTAEISVAGLLTQKRSIWAWFFGESNTTYGQINAGIATADADPKIKEIILNIDSPGGEFYGLFDTLAAISGARKKVTAVVNNMGASAAYAIAAQADKIVAANQATSVGSVGVVQTYYLDDTVVDITSDEAPEKRPDPKTEEGVKAIKKRLNDLHAIFVDAIAGGRSAATGKEVTTEQVNETYGRGGVLLAKDAQKNGMIDSIAAKKLPRGAADSPSNSEAAARPNQVEEKTMDAKELLAQHPETHAAVLAQGKTQGVEAERARVATITKMGVAAGAPEIAQKAIEDGTPASDDNLIGDLTAKKLENLQTTQRAEENPETEGVTHPAETTEMTEAELAAAVDSYGDDDVEDAE